MVGQADGVRVIAPSQIIVPSLSGGNILGPLGTLQMSGSKLYIFTTKWELITSA